PSVTRRSHRRRRVGAGLHLLPPEVPGTVVGATIPGMSDQTRSHPAADDAPVREMADIPAVEVISRASVMIMSAAAEKLGLADEDPDQSPHRDLDEARRLITGLAALVTSTAEYLGPHAAPMRDGLQSLQRAFREASAFPDEPGEGPGEKFTGPVR